ncbi:hypothetical protein HDU98_001816 [Podochytrium sp. JEL0797]|nr:hypothetical protein HDU98_001816 [Podochytrium sp. JEL0797]
MTPVREKLMPRRRYDSDHSDPDDEHDLFLPILSRLRTYKSENESLKKRLAELELLVAEQDIVIRDERASAQVERENARIEREIARVEHENARVQREHAEVERENARIERARSARIEKTNLFLSQRMEDVVRSTQQQQPQIPGSSTLRGGAAGASSIQGPLCHGCKITLF